MATANDTLVITGPESMTVATLDMPSVGTEDVLIETEASLISTGTETTVYSGEFPEGSHWDEYADYPTMTGYMNLGTVVETGEDVDGLEVGDRVVSSTRHAKYVAPNADLCYPVPDHVSDDEAIFFATAAIAMHAVRRGRVTWGETAAVFGLGLVGQLVVRILHFAGVRPVIGLNRSQPRIDMLPDVEGVVGVRTDDHDWVDDVRTVTDGDLAETVFEATGNADAIPDELQVLQRQGRFVVLGCPQGATEFDFHDYCNRPSYELIGAHITSHPTVETLQTPWTEGRHVNLFFDAIGEPAMADLDTLVTTRRPYEQAGEIYDALLAGEIDEPSVVLSWK